MAKGESLEKQAAHGAKWDQLSREQQDYLAEKVPEMYGSSPRKPFNPGTLARRVEDAKESLHGSRVGKHLVAKNRETDLQAGRAALSPKQQQFRPPTAPEREKFSPKEEHQWLTREELCGIIEIAETEANRYAMLNQIEFKSDGQGGLVYNADNVLDHATKHGLIQKTKIREYLDTHGGQR